MIDEVAIQLGIAFSLGLVGSIHCGLMCGPIALIANKSSASTARFWGMNLTYNLGRITTYVLLGVLAGMLGTGFDIMGWQQSLSILVGCSLLMIGVFKYLLPKLAPKSFNYGEMTSWFYARAGHLLKGQSWSAKAMLGMVNGLLPCGLVYGAMAGSLTQSSLRQSMLFMLAFGAGTLPMMLSVPLLHGIKPTKWTGWVRHRVTPVLFGVMAVLMIMRGMNLGIPFVSPANTHTSTGHVEASCH